MTDMTTTMDDHDDMARADSLEGLTVWIEHLAACTAQTFEEVDELAHEVGRVARKLDDLGLTEEQWDSELLADDAPFRQVWDGLQAIAEVAVEVTGSRAPNPTEFVDAYREEVAT